MEAVGNGVTGEVWLSGGIISRVEEVLVLSIVNDDQIKPTIAVEISLVTVVGLPGCNVLESESQASGVLGVDAHSLTSGKCVDANDVLAAVAVEVARNCHVAEAGVDLRNTQHRGGSVVEDSGV